VLVGFLIAFEPLIDMVRTALNVSGAITSGTLTSRLLSATNMAVFDGDADLNMGDAMPAH